MAEIVVDEMVFRSFFNPITQRVEFRLRQYDGNEKVVTIPESVENCPVTVIGQWAFEKKCLEKVYYPDGIYSIEDGAFLECKYLTSIESYASEHLADKIEILHLAFDRCESLRRFQAVVPVFAWYQSFEKCTSLTDFSAKISGFGYRAFAGSLLKELHFTDDVLWGKGSFEGMSLLKDLYFDGKISGDTCKSYIKYIRRKRLHVDANKFNHMELVYDGTEILT